MPFDPNRFIEGLENPRKPKPDPRVTAAVFRDISIGCAIWFLMIPVPAVLLLVWLLGGF